MDEAERVLLLVGDVYDAALDPALWPTVLEGLCGFIPGCMASLFAQDSASKVPNRYISWGMDAHYLDLYLQTYAKMHPLLPGGLFVPVGEVYSSTDIIPNAELEETQFYKEWLKPQKYIDFVGCNVEKSTMSCALLAVIRHERNGIVDDATRRRMALLAPHVRRSVLIGKVIELNKVEAAALADSLDGLAAGMFLVDAGGRIVHANVSGHRQLAEAAVIHVAGGRLVANDPRTHHALYDVFAAAAAGDAAIGVKGISVPLPGRDGEDFVAHVLPLTSAARRQAGISYAAVAAVFVQKASTDLQSPIEGLSRRFRLTAGEVRVLLAIVNVGSVAETARVLGIGEGTVRSHLHRLFEKTGTARQADLVKLVGGYASPLIG